MSQEPIEPDSVEYLEEPRAPSPVFPQAVVYQSEGLPCCSGCGCLLLSLAALLVFDLGKVVNGILLVATAAVLSGAVLRLAGVKRFSPYYAYLLVPVFLISMNLISKLVSGNYPFTWFEVTGATVAIYAFLYAARSLGRP